MVATSAHIVARNSANPLSRFPTCRAFPPTSYVFPNRFEDLEVLRTAARLNLQDATARYLLEPCTFTRSNREALLSEQARMLNPQIPVLHAV